MIALAGSLLLLTASPAIARTATTENLAKINKQLAGLAVPFERNAGQFDPRVAYAAKTFAGSTFVTRDGRIVHALEGDRASVAAPSDKSQAAKSAPKRGWSLVETLVGTQVRPRGMSQSETKVNRYIGSDPARWQSHITTYERVSLGEAWPGIQVELAMNGTNVEKLFTVAPGADLRKIQLKVAGARRLNVNSSGALEAATGNGPLTFTAPVAWQDIAGDRRPVTVAYTLAGLRYGFALGDHDRGYPVVIDPVLQTKASPGGDFALEANAIAVDANGNVFVAGTTSSADFPGTAGGAQQVSHANADAFVAKFDNTLSVLIQATFLGGTLTEQAFAIAVDAGGSVFVTGTTGSSDFPGTAGGAQAAPGGGDGDDVFVAKFNNGLTTLVQGTYLGSTRHEGANSIAVDARGDVFVAGRTLSPDFPRTAGGAQASFTGFVSDNFASNAFVAKLNNGLTAIAQATYLGGSGVGAGPARTGITAIALDVNDNVYVTGFTQSSDLPGTTGGAQATYSGGYEGAFVARLDNGLTALIQATYLGGNGPVETYAAAIALDGNGNVFVAGSTNSPVFPGTAGGARAYGGSGRDGFVARLNGDLTVLTQATYLGLVGYARALGVAVDADGKVFVAGGTNALDFVNHGGRGDAFVFELNSELTTLAQSIYLGGNSDELINAIALDAGGAVFVAGTTVSTNFPGSIDGVQSLRLGRTGDAFVARLPATIPQGIVVEFYNAALDHYFITGFADEQRAVDAGAAGNWQRTGGTFKSGGLTQVCRFYGNTRINGSTQTIYGPNSHFYTASAAECAQLQAIRNFNRPSWMFESRDFRTTVPNEETCPAATVPVYRAYNNGLARGADSNHRITASLSAIDDVVARGWIYEGIVMCAPQ